MTQPDGAQATPQAAPQTTPGLDIRALLKAVIDKGASDLHITTGAPPQLRIDGRLVPLRIPPLSAAQSQTLCYSVLTENQRERFKQCSELDLSFGVANLSRFRANLYRQRGNVVGAFRQIPFEIKPLHELGVPRGVNELTRRPSGLVLITGPTGSGKSTTLASLIDMVNTERHGHIITVEDPIEFLHSHKGCLVNQREVGKDTRSFKEALKYVLRQDPDVVLIGEMRDLDTIEATMTIAETGHLTFATLHTNSAAQTINRIIDVFPPHQQSQVRAQLSFILQGVLCQQLVPKISGGRALATELMVPNPAIRNLIREDKMHQLYTQMQVGRQQTSMHTMNQSLYELVSKRQITAEVALTKSPELDDLRRMLASGPGPA